MPNKFEKAYTLVMKNEGGYSNRASDRGGETYKGVARKKHPSWVGWPLVDAMKKLPDFPASLDKNINLQNFVRSFYKEQFWDRNRLSEVDNFSIACELFDTGVNMGIATAAMFAQRALNVLNRNAQDYRDIAVDGLIGSATIHLINAHKYPRLLFDVLNTLQGAKYVAIAEADPTQEVNMYGWLSRVYAGPETL